MSVPAFLVAIAVLLVSSTAAAAKSAETFRFGAWYGSAETNRQSNTFTGCLIWAQYKNGITVHFRKTRRSTLITGFHNRNWRLDKDFHGSIEIYVDGEKLGKFKITPTNSRRFMATLGVDDQITQRISQGRSMHVIGPNMNVRFKLAQVGDALARAEKCVANQLALERSSANSVARAPERRTNDGAARNYRKSQTRSKARNVSREAWELFAMVAIGEEAKVVSVEPRLRKFGFEQSWSRDGIRGFAGRWKRAGSIDTAAVRVMAAVGGICENYTAIEQKSARGTELELKSTLASCRINQEIKYIATTISRTPKIDSVIFHIGGESRADELQSINDRVLAFLRGIRKKQ